MEKGQGLMSLEDYLYLIPAATFSVVLFLSSGIYVLVFFLQCYRHRRRGRGGIRTAESRRLKFTVRYFPSVAIIAGLIVLERIIYRHAYPFALGLELVLLKVCTLLKRGY
jgi:hypothetical protein